MIARTGEGEEDRRKHNGPSGRLRQHVLADQTSRHTACDPIALRPPDRKKDTIGARKVSRPSTNSKYPMPVGVSREKPLPLGERGWFRTGADHRRWVPSHGGYPGEWPNRRELMVPSSSGGNEDARRYRPQESGLSESIERDDRDAAARPITQ